MDRVAVALPGQKICNAIRIQIEQDRAAVAHLGAGFNNTLQRELRSIAVAGILKKGDPALFGAEGKIIIMVMIEVGKARRCCQADIDVTERRILQDVIRRLHRAAIFKERHRSVERPHE